MTPPEKTQEEEAREREEKEKGEHHKMDLRSLSSSSSGGESGDDQEVAVVMGDSPPTPLPLTRKRTLMKQMSMMETRREAKWEKRRRQIFQRRKSMMEQDEEVVDGDGIYGSRVRSLTDEDLDELRGSIELGFGFNEDDGGHHLCGTLPALNLYFAVNRQLLDSKLHSPSSVESTPTPSSTMCGTPCPGSPHQQNLDPWTVFSPGDNPQHVKTRLRHWARVVAFSVRQCY